MNSFISSVTSSLFGKPSVLETLANSKNFGVQSSDDRGKGRSRRHLSLKTPKNSNKFHRFPKTGTII